MLSGGYLKLQDGGSAFGTRLFKDGALAIASGSEASGTEVGSHARETVSSGGVESGVVVSSGGQLVVVSGGALLHGATLDGGTATLSGTFGTGVVMSFVGGGGGLVLHDATVFSGGVSGFGAGDTISLTDVPYALSETITFVEAIGNASGTLTATTGAISASAKLIGQYATSNFLPGSATGGGTSIAFVS